MSTKNVCRLSICCVLLFLATTSAPAAQIIVQDGFSGSNGAALAGRTPDTVDVPGTTYTTYTNSNCCGFAQPTIDTSAGNLAPSANSGFNGATYLNIGSTVGYSLPSEIAISGDVQINSIINNDGATYPRGVGLGFFGGTPNSGEASTTFTGLVVNPDGTLRLVTAGAPGLNASTTSFAAPFAGFSASNFYHLSYDVNTVTGAITDVVFNGNDDTAAFASVLAPGFEPSGGNLLAGFYGSTSANANFFGRVDNFEVAAVPEPSSLVALGGLGMVGLLMAARRRHRKARRS